MLMRTNVFPLAFLDIRDSVSNKEICFVYKYLAPLYFYNIIAYIYIYIYISLSKYLARISSFFFYVIRKILSYIIVYTSKLHRGKIIPVHAKVCSFE